MYAGFNKFGLGLVLAFAVLQWACSKSDDVAGGVTDIGNSLATVSGVVIDGDGSVLSSARVLAYYDSWNQTSLSDSIEISIAVDGTFSVDVDTSKSVVLYAESGETCVLASLDVTAENKLVLGNKRILESSVSGATAGFVRIVGTNIKANVSSDGSFRIEQVPPGDITMVYVQDDKPQGFIDMKTTDERENIYLPPFDKRQEDGRFTHPEGEQDKYGVEFEPHGPGGGPRPMDDPNQEQ